MTTSIWNGFRRIDFEFLGREAILVFPNEPNENKNYLLKTEYFDAFPDFEIEMVKRGWHLAYIKNITRWCLDEDLELKAKFCDFLTKEYGLCKKCTPVGMSCGGMIAVKFAARFPEKVSCLYLDAPVMNLLSCPAGLGVGGNELYEEFVLATGMTMSQLICYREHPIDKIDILLQSKIPIILVYGEDDTVVPYVENGKILEDKYRKAEEVIETYGKKNCGHHPHGLCDNTPIVKFVEKYGI